MGMSTQREYWTCGKCDQSYSLPANLMEREKAYHENEQDWSLMDR